MIVVPHHVSALYVGVCGLGLALACGAGVSREEAERRTPNSGRAYYVPVYPASCVTRRVGVKISLKTERETIY